jgi:hypothetical protein
LACDGCDKKWQAVFQQRQRIKKLYIFKAYKGNAVSASYWLKGYLVSEINNIHSSNRKE